MARADEQPQPLRTLTVGHGPPLVLLHGYAMQPETYLPLAELLADRVEVVIPAIFEIQGAWRFDRVLRALEATFAELGLERMTLVGHSFGGGLELGLAATHPDQVVECVFADTLGVHARFRLAGEALHHPIRLASMATRRSVGAFARSWTSHPRQLAAAALWGFLSERGEEIDRIARLGIPCHVLWASRDSLLARSSGEEFARLLKGTFSVASAPGVDHDWMFEDPELFARHLDALGLEALSGPGEAYALG